MWQPCFIRIERFPLRKEKPEIGPYVAPSDAARTKRCGAEPRENSTADSNFPVSPRESPES
jgi:hypothetical protein